MSESSTRLLQYPWFLQVFVWVIFLLQNVTLQWVPTSPYLVTICDLVLIFFQIQFVTTKLPRKQLHVYIFFYSLLMLAPLHGPKSPSQIITVTCVYAFLSFTSPFQLIPLATLFISVNAFYLAFIIIAVTYVKLNTISSLHTRDIVPSTIPTNIQSDVSHYSSAEIYFECLD